MAPISKINNVIVETAIANKDQFDRTGVIRHSEFAVSDRIDPLKQIKFDASLMSTNVSTTIKAGSASSDIVITLPASSGTLATGSSNSFSTVQPDAGTSPTASSSTDTLTLNSSDSTITITGNSTTDTINFQARVADGTHSGIVSTSAQTIAGAKTMDQVILPKGGYNPPGIASSHQSTTGIFFDTGVGSDDSVNIMSNNTLMMTFDKATGVTDPFINVSQRLLLTDGSSSQPSFGFYNEGSTGLYRSGSHVLSVSVNGTNRIDFDNSGNVTLNTAGGGIHIKEGANACMGTASLNGLTEVTITTNKVTNNSRIFLTINSPGGTLGTAYVSSRSAGTSFGIKSTNTLDTSTCDWIIFEPS